MMGWQWQQLDHIQIICILLHTDNHVSIYQLIFIGQMLFLMQANNVKALKAKEGNVNKI